MSKEPQYASDVAVIKEKWTKRGGRFEIKSPANTTIFEFDDSSEMRDQLRNARFEAQRMLDHGVVKFVADHVGWESRATDVVVKDGYILKEREEPPRTEPERPRG